MKSFISFLLSLLILQLQTSCLLVSAQELAAGAPGSGVMITPLRGGVEVLTKKGARVIRKVKRVRYYRPASGGSKRSVRRYHIVRHTQASNKRRFGNKVISRASSTKATTVHSPSMELPRDIVTPLIIRGVDNLQAGKRYVEIVERDGKLFIKEGGDIDPNGQFLEVVEEDGVWKIKGTDIIVDFANTFDVSKVPPGVRKYINPATDHIPPGENYVQYMQGDGAEIIPVQSDTIPPDVQAGDYVELYQVPVGGELAPGSWETIDVTVGNASSMKEAVPLHGFGAGPGPETAVGELPVAGIGVPGLPMTEVPVGGVTGPGVPVTSVPIDAGVGIKGVPTTEVPVGGIGVPGMPMPVGGGIGSGPPPPAAVPAKAEDPPPQAIPPVIPVTAVPPASETAPAAAIPAAGFPMSSPVDKPGNIVPFTPIGAVPPPAAGGGGFGIPFAGMIPAALGAAALGGLIVPMALMGRNNGSGGGYGYYPVPGQGSSPPVTGSAPGFVPSPQVAPTTPPTPPVCPTPQPPCPPTPPCPPQPPIVCPPQPPYCPPQPPYCPPQPPYCPPQPPICNLPPPCPPTPCPPIYGGCDTGFGYGYGCDTGYGYGGGYGCDSGYGYGGGGYGYDSGYGYGNPCMGNASKFGFNQPDSCATSYKERWWSQAGRQYDYNGPCAAEQASGSCGPNCAPSRSTAMSNPCPPY